MATKIQISNSLNEEFDFQDLELGDFLRCNYSDDIFIYTNCGVYHTFINLNKKEKENFTLDFLIENFKIIPKVNIETIIE